MSHLDFIEDLPDNYLSALSTVCDKYDELETAASRGGDWDLGYYDQFIDFIALVNTIIIKNNLNIGINVPTMVGDPEKNMMNITNYFSELRQEVLKQQTEDQLTRATESINIRMGTGFYYEFSDDDIGKIPNLISELRALIANSEVLEEDYKNRLLKRLERLQSEVHKRVSDLDRFWGVVGDAGVMLGKFGEDVKPIVDRIKELTEIVWKAQAGAEQLPSDSEFPLLTKDDATK